VAALAAGERCRAVDGFSRLDDLHTSPKLVAQGLLLGQRPLLVRRQSIRPKASLGTVRQLVGQANRAVGSLSDRHQKERGRKLRAKLERLDELLRQKPAQAKAEIAKHLDGELTVRPLPWTGPERRVEIHGRAKQNSLLEGQEAVCAEVVAGAGFEPATFGL